MWNIWPREIIAEKKLTQYESASLTVKSRQCLGTQESQTLLQNLTQLILHGEEIKQVIVKVTQNN